MTFKHIQRLTASYILWKDVPQGHNSVKVGLSERRCFESLGRKMQLALVELRDLIVMYFFCLKNPLIVLRIVHVNI